jgi:acyl carrier protein
MESNMTTPVQAETQAATSTRVIDTLKDIAIKVLKLEMPASALNEQTNLYELGLESLNVVELLVEIEAAFDIVVDVEDLNGEMFAVLGDVAAFVQAKLDGKR